MLESALQKKHEALCLVIDDYFALCVTDVANPSEPMCLKRLRTATAAYAGHQLEGSDDKDILGVDIGLRLSGQKLILPPTPVLKALSRWPLLSANALPCPCSPWSAPGSRILRTACTAFRCLLGNWTSALLFRRPLMSVLSASYGIVDTRKVEPSRPRLVKLPRPVAQELVLLN